MDLNPGYGDCGRLSQCTQRSGWLCGMSRFLGWGGRFNAKENEERYLMIEVRPEEYKDGIGSYMTLNMRDMRSKLGYTTLYDIALKNRKLERRKLCQKKS